MRWSINKRSDGFLIIDDGMKWNEMKWNDWNKRFQVSAGELASLEPKKIVKLSSSPRFEIFSFIFGTSNVSRRAFYVPWLTHKSTRETKGNNRETREMFLSQSFISSPVEERRMMKERKKFLSKKFSNRFCLRLVRFFSSRAQSLHAHTSSTALISFLLDSAFPFDAMRQPV